MNTSALIPALAAIAKAGGPAEALILAVAGEV